MPQKFQNSLYDGSKFCHKIFEFFEIKTQKSPLAEARGEIFIIY